MGAVVAGDTVTMVPLREVIVVTGDKELVLSRTVVAFDEFVAFATECC